MIGGAVGALAAHLAHASGDAQAFWALIGMGSMLAGSLGVPLTAILFSLEVTHYLPALLPLTMACIASYLVTSLLMPRSILTEKLSRRGYHLSREYGVDPLETVMVRELMTPVPRTKAALPPFYTYADGTARGAAEMMATEGLATLPVVDRKSQEICGTISLTDLLRGRTRSMERETERSRLLGNALPGSTSTLNTERVIWNRSGRRKWQLGFTGCGKTLVVKGYGPGSDLRFAFMFSRRL
jgi:chloride channel protein, CIC family